MRLPLFMAGMMALVLSTGAISVTEAATDSRKDIRAAKSKPLVRGGIVYKNYCVLCHGERGDGMARATKLYGQGNLVITIDDHNEDYYEKLIREGGTAMLRSKFMPAYQDELTEEQIFDVLQYLTILNDPVARGEVVYKTNCILCHGVKGNGKGRASVMYDPPPADLTRSDKNDDYKRMIITMGGAAMGRSAIMPEWGLQLKKQEIEDVIAYLRTILVE